MACSEVTGNTYKKTYLYTGETYSTTKCVAEQLTDRVVNAQITKDYPLVFAVNSDFIRENMEGRFDNTAIVMMGCFGLYFDDLAAAFVEKGASVYLGWNATVTLDYVDNATLNLIANLCTANITVGQGVAKTMAEVGPDRYFNAWLNYYSPSNCSQTIRELIR